LPVYDTDVPSNERQDIHERGGIVLLSELAWGQAQFSGGGGQTMKMPRYTTLQGTGRQGQRMNLW